MSDDLEKRLREVSGMHFNDRVALWHHTINEAADALTRLRSENEARRDALDHIMRVARQGISPTKRLDWIEIRARYAIEGKAWSPDIRETPRDSVKKMEKDFAECRAENEALKGECERLREAIKAHNDGCESACKWKYEHGSCAYRNADGAFRYGDKRCSDCLIDFAIEVPEGAAK